MAPESVLNASLLIDGVRPLRTVMEDDFGHPLSDVCYFPTVVTALEVQKLFICPLQLEGIA
jgi:hypothetical protein